MTFDRPATAYDNYMGPYARRLAPVFATFAGVAPGMRVVDVGAGTGALTEVLAERLGPSYVAAAEPSAMFARACAERLPDADVREAPAEELPWADGTFDTALAQLVVAFMADPAVGLREMRRVVKPGGVVAACTWDLNGAMTMLSNFWEAALVLDPDAPTERARGPFWGPDLEAFWADTADLVDVTGEQLDVEVIYGDFDDYWSSFGRGVGPAGGSYVTLDGATQEAVREECRRRLGDPSRPFSLPARAWAVRGHVPT